MNKYLLRTLIIVCLAVALAVLAAPAAAAPLQQTEATGGSICVNAFHDENANGLHEPNEGYMAGVTFTIANETEIIGQAVSNGNQNPACVHNLTPGVYQVAQEIPSPLEMTTAGNAAIVVEDGITMGVEFGSRIRQNTPDLEPQQPETAVDPAEDASSAAQPEESGIDWLTISGLVVILLAVVLLGVLLFVLLRQ